MLWKKKDTNRDQRLDHAGRALMRAARASEEEIEAAISSPALFGRIRARATESRATEGAGQHGTSNNWAAAFTVAWRATAALSLVALLALALWLGAKERPPNNSFDNAQAAPDIIRAEQAAPATACSVATKEECAVSTDDAVAILVSASQKEANR
jgi:hypothetical protein